MTPSLVLVPTYNECENLPRIVTGLAAFADSAVLVIDDSSPDGTGDVAETLRDRYPRLSVLHRKRRAGLGRAYVHGFKTAIGRGHSCVVTMDADLSYDPDDVPRPERALKHADFIIGSPHSLLGGMGANGTVWRQVLSKFSGPSWVFEEAGGSLHGVQAPEEKVSRKP